ncbi:hypothetical protein BIFDEN_01115 [Bifidobacterium dentium ATCC 27678]|nr:hypothetical protein BIFDEN_01115 [Bifidobacterium dentium ATCC 27678]
MTVRNLSAHPTRIFLRQYDVLAVRHLLFLSRVTIASDSPSRHPYL